MLFQYSPALMPMPAAVTSSSWLLETASLNLAAVMTAIYVTCYLIMDPVAGGTGRLLRAEGHLRKVMHNAEMIIKPHLFSLKSL